MMAFDNHDAKIFTDDIEQSAVEQINQLLSIDVFSKCKIRIMPDVHAGAGCVIGFTGDLGDKVIPNIVGVDIGCGILVQAFVCVGNLWCTSRKTDCTQHPEYGEHCECDKAYI